MCAGCVVSKCITMVKVLHRALGQPLQIYINSAFAYPHSTELSVEHISFSLEFIATINSLHISDC